MLKADGIILKQRKCFLIASVNSVHKQLKGTDRLCKVVELSMQCCGQIL